MEKRVQELMEKVEALQREVEDLKADAPEDQISLVVFSGDLDRLLAAFIIAVGAAAMFERVVMFFTFWAVAALRDKKKKVRKEDVMAKMFGAMLPSGAGDLKLSNMNMAGMGTRMMKSLMGKKGVLSLEELMATAGESGVEVVICEMSMDLMGLKLEEMIDYPDVKLAGVGTFLHEAGQSKTTLFI